MTRKPLKPMGRDPEGDRRVLDLLEESIKAQNKLRSEVEQSNNVAQRGNTLMTITVVVRIILYSLGGIAALILGLPALGLGIVLPEWLQAIASAIASLVGVLGVASNGKTIDLTGKGE